MAHPSKMTFDEFVGPYLLGENFEIDGRRDFDFGVIWEWKALADPVPLPLPDGYGVARLDGFEPECTFVLIGPAGERCGFYATGQVWVDEAHRGRGLAVHLISAAARYRDGSPTVGRHGIGFSNAGLAAHRAAHRSFVAQALEADREVPDRVLSEYPELMDNAMKVG